MKPGIKGERGKGGKDEEDGKPGIHDGRRGMG